MIAGVGVVFSEDLGNAHHAFVGHTVIVQHFVPLPHLPEIISSLTVSHASPVGHTIMHQLRPGIGLRLLLDQPITLCHVPRSQGSGSILQTNKVFFNRKQAFTNALNRLSSNHIWRMLDKALQIDKAIKGASFSNPWDEINILVLELSGEKILN